MKKNNLLIKLLTLLIIIAAVLPVLLYACICGGRRVWNTRYI